FRRFLSALTRLIWWRISVRRCEPATHWGLGPRPQSWPAIGASDRTSDRLRSWRYGRWPFPGLLRGSYRPRRSGTWRRQGSRRLTAGTHKLGHLLNCFLNLLSGAELD